MHAVYCGAIPHPVACFWEKEQAQDFMKDNASKYSAPLELHLVDAVIMPLPPPVPFGRGPSTAPRR